MPRWITGIGSGCTTAAGAAVLYWCINTLHQVNGVGLLQRQGWPLNQLWIWAAVGFGIGIIAGGRQAVGRERHAHEVRELADQLGRAYAESYSLPPGAGGMPVFAGWSSGRHAMTGAADGVPVAVFDYTATRQGSDSTTQTNGTSALLPAADLPNFDLRPRTIGWRMLGWAGFEGVTFASETGGSFTAETVRQFTALFHLSVAGPMAVPAGLDADTLADLAAQEEAIRRVFTPAVMERLNRYPTYAVQSRSGYLAVWRASGVLPPGARVELWDAAVALRAALTDPPDRRTDPVVAGRAGKDTSRQARKLRNTVLGGVVGLFVGFIAAAMVMSFLFFQHVPGQGPGLSPFLNPLLFIGLFLVGAAAGAGIGASLPVRELRPQPAEDRARRDARARATGYGAVVGLFLGFFAGSAVFTASQLLLDGKLGNFGVEAALFFGSSFGGALLGAVAVGVAVNRLYGWRKRR